MNTREAVIHLADRARRTARLWYVGGAIAMVVGGFVIAGLLVALQVLFLDGAFIKYSLLAGIFASAGVVAPMTRKLLRRRLAFSRPQWIEDLARIEGLSARELEEFFTLDSW